jgi:DNA-binding transcriptional MerR regulator
MPLADVKEYIQLCLQGDPTIPTRYQMIRNQVQRAEAELAAMQKRIDTLRIKVNYYNGLLQERKADTCNPLNQVQTSDEGTPEKRSTSMPA